MQLQFSRFFEQSATQNNHLLRYLPTIHHSISKICPKFHVLSSHFSEVNDLIDDSTMSNEHQVKIVLRENILLRSPVEQGMIVK